MMTEADADKLMKQAKKLSEPSLLTMRLKGDWEQATPLYEKAAGLYRVMHSKLGVRCKHHLVVVQQACDNLCARRCAVADAWRDFVGLKLTPALCCSKPSHTRRQDWHMSRLQLDKNGRALPIMQPRAWKRQQKLLQGSMRGSRSKTSITERHRHMQKPAEVRQQRMPS